MQVLSFQGKTVAPSRKYRRGYPVALLIGLNQEGAVLWKVFSNIVKPERTVKISGSRGDPKAVYNFHEAVVDALRPTLKEGTRSVIVAAPPRTDFSQSFLSHIRSHHAWLTQGANKATFSEITGSASTLPEVAELAKKPVFRQAIAETTEQEEENLLGLLEKKLNMQGSEVLVLYSLEEIEDAVYGSWLPGKPVPEYLLVNENYPVSRRGKNRVQRLLQVATNRRVKTKTVKADSAAGKRLAQLGGMVCLLKKE